jgi:FixJ family two-component response regulator
MEVSTFERIRKPFTEKDLIAAVETALSQTKRMTE